MNVEHEYWFSDFERLTERLEALAVRSSRPAEIFQVGKTWSGRRIPAIRIGRGKEFNPLITAGNHGAEVLGPYGCVAIADTLLNDTSPTGENLSGWADKILERCTVTILPYINIDGACRFRDLEPTCDFNVRYKTDAAEWQRYVYEYNEPRYHYRDRGETVAQWGFTEQQAKTWRDAGRPMGLRYSDQGIDLYFDYKTFKAPETTAVRDFLLKENPCAVLEIHNQEPPSRVFAPLVDVPTKEGLAQLAYGEEMMTQLFRRGLPGSKHSVHTYTYYLSDEYLQFPEFVYRTLGCITIFAEITTGYMGDPYREDLRNNPLHCRDADASCPTRAERILTGWSWMHTFLDLGLKRGFK